LETVSQTSSDLGIPKESEAGAVGITQIPKLAQMPPYTSGACIAPP